MMRFLSIVLAGLLWTLTSLAGVNVNTATVTELTQLPGIGQERAAAIVQHRSQNGPFKSLTDLDAVSGIGPKTLDKIKPLIQFSTDGKPAAVTSGAPHAPSGGQQSGSRVNINTADATTLDTLPGVGPSRAAAILAHRKKNGPFKTCESLIDIYGIGPKTVEKIRPVCTTEETSK